MQDKISFDAEGNRHGLYEKYWDNGQLRYKGEYIHGIMHGPWIWYNKNGGVWFKAIVNKNVPTKYYIEYYNDGSIKSKQFYAR
jgi:antitoxin component YwqK of YwqJK toxin-antitoxin module